MKVLAYAASNSKQSINHQLVRYASSLLKRAQVEFIDINDFEMPLYSPEREETTGIPEQAHAFFKRIGQADALLISFAEHNGSFTAAYKNLFDWSSRIDMKVYQDKPAVMLATSPGGRGGAGVLGTATQSASTFGANLKGSVSVPSFYDRFNVEAEQLTDDALNDALITAVRQLEATDG